MNSLSDLNSFGSSSLEFTDPRAATVIFSKPSPVEARDQILEITSTTVSVPAGAEILEIINYATANVRYRVEIKSSGSPALTGSTISWASLPAGVTLTTVGSVYTLSGINSVAQWRQIKNFTWNLPAGYASTPAFWLEVKVIYYDQTLASDQNVNWRAYDVNFYRVSDMISTATLSIDGTIYKYGQATIVGAFTPVMNLRKLTGGSASLTCVASASATGQINADNLLATATLVAVGRFNPGEIKGNLTATATIVCNGVLVISNMYPRNYYANQENDIFLPDPPQIEDALPGASVFEFTVSCPIGTFSNSSTTTPVNPFTYSGTLAQVNTALATLKFYPTAGVSSSDSISYTQKKDTVTQLTRTITLNGNAASYPGATYTFNSSQLWNPPNQDLLYKSSVDTLLVGGGGGGAFGGGGGGGGVRETFGISLTQQTYSISIGGGGAPVAPHAVEQTPYGDPTSSWWYDWVLDTDYWYIRHAGGQIATVSGGVPYLGIAAISQESIATVAVLTPHYFTNGTAITFHDVTGMTELHGNTYYVNVTGSHTFRLYNDSGLTSPVNSSNYKTFISSGFCFFDEQYRYVGLNPSITMYGRFPNYYFYINDKVPSFNPNDQGSWQANKAYAFGDIINGYICVVAHTSSIIFDNTKWNTWSGNYSTQHIRGSWTTSTSYSVNDIVYYQNSTYLCQVAHTSSANFSSDSANWISWSTSWNFSLKNSAGTSFFNPSSYTVTGASPDAQGTTLPNVYFDPGNPYNRPYVDGYVFKHTAQNRTYVWNFQKWIDSGYTATGGWIQCGFSAKLGYRNATVNFVPQDAEAGNYIYCDADGVPQGNLTIQVFTATGQKAASGGNTTAFGLTATGGEGGSDFNYGALAYASCKGGNSGLPGVNDSTAYTGATSNFYQGAGGAGAGANGTTGTDPDGGNGKLSTITGQRYGGGGGGGDNEGEGGKSGEGGLGGGGNGADIYSPGGVLYHPPTPGTANTGGGGGAGFTELDNAEPVVESYYFAQSGGSGVVVVRFNA